VFYGDRRDKPDWPYSFLLEEIRMETFIRIIMEYVIHCPLLEMRELRDGKIHNNYYGISHTFYVTVNVGT
jgi:hypothetical protein